jgi:hypothetical protein
MVTNNEFQSNGAAHYSMMNEHLGSAQDDQFYNIASGMSTGGSF